EALGEPGLVLLGVDRLDYTKGILHRLQAYGELVAAGRLGPRPVLIQVASPSRERVEAYQTLRDEVEVMVGRINGEHGEVGYSPVHYLHQSYPREEMAALYLAGDVMLVTPLRDGMNLVAKEYVACRNDENGAPVRGIGGFPAQHPVQGAPGGFGPAGVFGPRRWRGGVLGLGLARRGGGLGVPLGEVLADVQVEERPGGVPEPAERAREAGHMILLG